MPHSCPGPLGQTGSKVAQYTSSMSDHFDSLKLIALAISAVQGVLPHRIQSISLYYGWILVARACLSLLRKSSQQLLRLSQRSITGLMIFHYTEAFDAHRSMGGGDAGTCARGSLSLKRAISTRSQKRFSLI